MRKPDQGARRGRLLRLTHPPARPRPADPARARACGCLQTSAGAAEPGRHLTTLEDGNNRARIGALPRSPSWPRSCRPARGAVSARARPARRRAATARADAGGQPARAAARPAPTPRTPGRHATSAARRGPPCRAARLHPVVELARRRPRNPRSRPPWRRPTAPAHAGACRAGERRRERPLCGSPRATGDGRMRRDRSLDQHDEIGARAL